MHPTRGQPSETIERLEVRAVNALPMKKYVARNVILKSEQHRAFILKSITGKGVS
jgi:hypothetical protein